MNIKKLDDINFPEILYKYRTWNNENHKRFITHKEVYMASPKKFKDHIDCKIPIRYDLMSKNQAEIFYKRLSQRTHPNISRQQRRKEIRKRVKAKEYKKQLKNEQYQQYYFKKFFKRIGILSLTSEPCLEEMWMKYADNMQGFCVGYNSKILFKHLGGGGNVEYYDKLPIIMPVPIMNPREIIYKQVYSKKRQLEFEKEYRTHKFWRNGAITNNRQIKIPKEAYHSVIIGKEMSKKHKIEITNAINENIGHLKIESTPISPF